MTSIIQKLANKWGYSIRRLPHPGATDNAFDEMRRLCGGIAAPIIFDVGAHLGHVAQAFRKLLPASTVYAFEPFPASYAQLTANTSNDPQIKTFNFGLSDRDGLQAFHSNASSATNSLLPTDASGANTWGAGLLETEAVVHLQFKTLDAVVDAMQLPKIDILKLDVQGAEYMVIRGAKNTCRQGMINLLYTEIITLPTYQGQLRFDELMAVYYGHGFGLHNIYNMNFADAGNLRQVDALFSKTAP